MIRVGTIGVVGTVGRSSEDILLVLHRVAAAAAAAKKSLGVGGSVGDDIRISLNHAFDGIVSVDGLGRSTDIVGKRRRRGVTRETIYIGCGYGQLGHDEVFVVLLVPLWRWI